MNSTEDISCTKWPEKGLILAAQNEKFSHGKRKTLSLRINLMDRLITFGCNITSKN
jgi:hypothetical protein